MELWNCSNNMRFHKIDDDIPLSEDDKRVISLNGFNPIPEEDEQGLITVPLHCKRILPNGRTITDTLSRTVKPSTDPVTYWFHTQYREKARLLQDKCKDMRLLIIQSDKNMGPCIVREHTYTVWVCNYLDANSHSYLQKPKEVIWRLIDTYQHKWFNWLYHHHGIHIEDLLPDEPPADINFRFPRLRLMPKMHKQPPGTRPIKDFRPIVDMSRCYLTASDKLLALTLSALRFRTDRPKSREVWSTQDFIIKLGDLYNEQIRTGSQFGRGYAIDIEAMYTSIDITHLRHLLMEMWDCCFDTDEGLKVVIKASAALISRDDFATLLHLNLEYMIIQVTTNCLALQAKGIPMGSSSAPCLAIFYMSMVEYRLKTSLPKTYLRYVDDIYTLSTLQCIHKFEKRLKKLTGLSIKIDTKPNPAFLDTVPTLSDGILTFKPYKKPQDQSLPLHALSNSPPNWKIGMVFGEIHRLATVWNANTDQECQKMDMNKMISRWREAGYNPRWVWFHMFKALLSTRMAQKHRYRQLNGRTDHRTVLEGLKRSPDQRKYIKQQVWTSEYLPGDSRFRRWLIGAADATRPLTRISTTKPKPFAEFDFQTAEIVEIAPPQIERGIESQVFLGNIGLTAGRGDDDSASFFFLPLQ